MKKFVPACAFVLAVSACGLFPALEEKERPAESQEASVETRPVARPSGVAPPSGARTAEQFDTTTAEERTAAVTAAQAASAERDLGVTIASLGAVAEPGIWMKTPLVSAPAKGRVDYPAKGTSVVLDLIPLEGERGAGSQLSLAAMRLLEANLTDLPEVRVFRTGG